MRRLRRPLCFLAMLPVLPGAVAAGEVIFRHDYAGHADTFVEIESVFGAVANRGSLPYRLTIRNHSGKARVWTVGFLEGTATRPLSTRASWRIEVEHGGEARREVTFAFAPAFLAYHYRNLEIEVGASGLPSQSRSVGAQAPQDFPLLAISPALAERSLGRLDAETKRRQSGAQCFAHRFEPAQLPVDWLGYTGLDGLLLDLPAWRGLSAAQRQALVAWVRTGGRLHLYFENEVDPAALALPFAGPIADGDARPLSLGEVRFSKWDGAELANGVISTFAAVTPSFKALEDDYSGKWPLLGEAGDKKFNAKPVFFLLLAFAVLVAPVNLFYFARPGRRHRLFVTTPLISVGTCLLIVLMIFFIDGIGGRGLRVVLADLQPGPGETRLYTTQEQFSRTGVMVRASFAPARLYDLQPVNLPQSRFNPFSPQSRRPATFEMASGRYHGPFFRSRSEQGFSLRSVEPSRARIDYGGEEEGVPVLVSNLAHEIVAFHYRDAKGGLWTGEPGANPGPGSRIPLVKVEEETWPDWIQEPTALFSGSQQQHVRRLQSDKHRFFARVRDPEAYALPTHPGVRWTQTHLLLTGTPAGGPADAAP